MTALGLIVVDVVDILAGMTAMIVLLNERRCKSLMEISRLDIHHDIDVPSADPSARQRSGFTPMYSKGSYLGSPHSRNFESRAWWNEHRVAIRTPY